jgi:hypothetical protein
MMWSRSTEVLVRSLFLLFFYPTVRLMYCSCACASACGESAKNDLTRQLWINAFQLHETRNAISTKLTRLTVPEKAKIYSEHVYKPYVAPTAPTAPPAKPCEFLFATDNGAPLDEVRGQSSVTYRPQKSFAIKERFSVLWPQTFTYVACPFPPPIAFSTLFAGLSRSLGTCICCCEQQSEAA